MYDLNNFCNIIASLRRQKGWTQAVFADKLGISPQSVSKWECGIGFPDVTLFPIIAEVLSVPIGMLFGERNETEDITMNDAQIEHVEEFKFCKEFDVCRRIDTMLGNVCRVEYIEREGEVTRVSAVGDPTFLRFLSVEKEPDRLLVEIKNPTGSATRWKPYDRQGYIGENYVQIFTGRDNTNINNTNYLDLVATFQVNKNGNFEASCCSMHY